MLRQPGVKRLREPEHPDLEQFLYLWFSDKRGNNIPINEIMLIEQAKRFGEHIGIEHNFKYSNGWLENFKFRFHIKSYTTSGENKSVDPLIVQKGLIDLKAVLCHYDLDDDIVCIVKGAKTINEDENNDNHTIDIEPVKV